MARPAAKWRMVFLCFLAQNLALGMAFGSFGALLPSTEEYFGVTRGYASLGMSLVTLTIGALAPIVGSLLQRVSLRTAMIGAAAISAVAYFGLAAVPMFAVALIMYALVGFGVTILAIIGPLTLITRWFSVNRAKVLSIVNLPIVLFLTPYLIAEFLPDHGRMTVLIAMGGIFLILAPLLFLIEDHPPQAPEDIASPASGSIDLSKTMKVGPPLTVLEILKRPVFWYLSIAVGLMAGVGTVFVVHIVPFGMDREMGLQAASSLMSVYAGAGVLGLLIFGVLADRIGAPLALALNAACQMLVFWGFLQVTGPALYGLAAIFGICSVPMVTLHGAALANLFHTRDVSKAMGYSYSLKLPFLFLLPPLIGVIYDWRGGYDMAFMIAAVLLALSALLFTVLLIGIRRENGTVAASAPLE